MLNEDSNKQSAAVIAVEQTKLVSYKASNEEEVKIEGQKKGDHDKLNVGSCKPI